MKKRIVAAGLICLDITPEFHNAPVRRVGDLLKPGSLVETGRAHMHVGGSVANTGLALKILGAEVVLMGKLGTDFFGTIVKNRLGEYVSTEHMIEVEGEETSYSVILAPEGIDRIFLHCKGANDSFTGMDPDYGEIAKADLFHFGYPPHMKNMWRNGGEELVRMFARVDSMGTATSLDMAALDEHTPAGQADWAAILKRTLPYVDFFVPSVEETAYMLDRPLYREWVQRADGGDLTEVIREEEVRQLAETLVSWGARIVLIKCGRLGMQLAAAGAEQLKGLEKKLGLDLSGWAGVRHFEGSYRPDRVCSATGAGDTAIAAFLYAVMLGYDPQACVRLAAAEGASCVEAYDSLSGLRSLKELEEKIAGGWEKQTL